MTVFIAHAEADRATAEALEKFLERRGLFVELENGERGFRHAQPSDTVVLLVSKELVFSPHRLLMEKRAMEAWADEQLVLVKLDHAFSPVGLRDLPSIDASIEPQRDIAWHAVAKQATESPMRRAREQARIDAPVDVDEMRTGGSLGGGVSAPAPQSRPAPRAPEPQKKVSGAKRSAVGLTLVFLLLVLLVGGAAVYAWLNLNVLEPMDPQGPLPPVLASINMTPERFVALLPILGPIVALVLIGLVFVALSGRKPKAKRAAESASPAAPPGDLLFVSYAHADDPAVSKVVETVVAQGRAVWSDKGGIGAGEGWAGEIVRAIRGARGVMIMCSPRAFESDHVKREVYLADRYKKPILPVFLEAASPPEDFEYFFAGVQWLELHKTPEGDRAAAIARALKAV